MVGEVDLDVEESGDRLVVRLDSGGPVELVGLTESFSALARLYERHYRLAPDDAAPKLFITKLATGSIWAEIAPYAVTFGQPTYQALSAANTIAGFSKRLSDGLKAFAGITTSPIAIPSKDDAADLREFVKPLTGKRGANLQIRHAKFTKLDGERTTVVEYSFDEAEINRAALNIDKALSEPAMLESAEAQNSKFLTEVMLVFEQASRAAGRESGRSADRTIISDVTDKPLATYFRKSIQGNLKDVMVRGGTNPLTDVGYIVDVHVQYRNGQPRAYVVTEFHDVVPLS